MKSLSFLLIALIPSLANGIERDVVDCHTSRIGLTSLVAPVEFRQFYDGQVTVYRVDTTEPACCSAGVAVVLPDVESELGEAKCVAVLFQNGIDLQGAQASYDTGRGLLIEMETTEYVDGANTVAGKPLKLRVNLQSSTVSLED